MKFEYKDDNENYIFMTDPMGNKNVIWVWVYDKGKMLYKQTSEESIIQGNIVWRRNHYSDNFKRYAEKVIKNIIFA